MFYKRLCIINNLPYLAHTTNYFRSNKILKVEDLYRFRILLYIYKTIYYNFDPFLFNCLTYHNQLHNHETRHCLQLILPLCHSTKSQHSIAFVGVKFWNALSIDIRNSSSLTVFTRNIKLHIFESYC